VRARAVSIAPVTGLGPLLAVAALRPAAPAAFHAPVPAPAGAPGTSGEPVRVRAIDVDSSVVPIRPVSVPACRADIDRGRRRCSAV
jgi:hypothetical protein